MLGLPEHLCCISNLLTPQKCLDRPSMAFYTALGEFLVCFHAS